MYHLLLIILLLSSGMLSGMDRRPTGIPPDRLAMTDAPAKKNRSCKQTVACCVPALSTLYFAAESLHELETTRSCGNNYGLFCFCAMVTCDRCLKNVKSIRDKAKQRKAYLQFVKKIEAQEKQKEN